MNAPMPWRDPVVAEIHAIRAELAREYANDLQAYSNAAVAHCREMHFVVADPVQPAPLEMGSSEHKA